MSRLAGGLLRRWYGGGEPGLFLRAPAWIYGILSGLRRRAYARGWFPRHRLPAPVVVVGNIVVGGAGKTPLVIAIIEHLRDRGWRPGVVSRGFGRLSREPVEVGATTPPSDGGDEPVLIARRTGVPVQVDADRVRAARSLLARGCDIVVADDGLQHYRLGRDVEIEVCDGARGYGNGRLIPAGPLREPIARAERCDLRVVNGGGVPGRHAMRLCPSRATAIGRSGQKPLSDFAGRRVHALAGIGNPARFFAALEAHGIEVVPHPFPDHHRYVAEDLRFDESLPILMTEKDAVKCDGIAPADAWAVPVDAELPDAFFAALDARLAALDARQP